MTRPYVTFIFSLLISDTFASLLLGLLLLFGSYLPVVGGISITGCVILIAEALKLAGVIVTVFHLLLMVIMHLIGVTHPVQCKKVIKSPFHIKLTLPDMIIEKQKFFFTKFHWISSNWFAPLSDTVFLLALLCSIVTVKQHNSGKPKKMDLCS